MLLIVLAYHTRTWTTGMYPNKSRSARFTQSTADVNHFTFRTSAVDCMHRGRWDFFHHIWIHSCLLLFLNYQMALSPRLNIYYTVIFSEFRNPLNHSLIWWLQSFADPMRRLWLIQTSKSWFRPLARRVRSHKRLRCEINGSASLSNKNSENTRIWTWYFI